MACAMILPVGLSILVGVTRVHIFVVVQSLYHFLELAQTHVYFVMPSNHLILCRPLLLLTSVFPSITVFSNESALCIRGPKHWSFSFNISPSSEYSGLISFKIDLFDLLAVRGTRKRLLQHHSWKHQFFGALPSSWSSSHNCS